MSTRTERRLAEPPPVVRRQAERRRAEEAWVQELVEQSLAPRYQVPDFSGVRRAPGGADVQRLHHMEIASGPFERRVRIPVAFERERVSAHLADGFLTVTLPRRMPVRRRVEVESAR